MLNLIEPSLKNSSPLRGLRFCDQLAPWLRAIGLSGWGSEGDEGACKQGECRHIEVDMVQGQNE